MAHIQALLLAAALSGPVGAGPVQEALLVTSSGEGTVQVLHDPAQPPDTVLRLDDGPARTVVSADGRYALVAHPGRGTSGDRVTLIDVPARRVARVVPLGYTDEEGVEHKVFRPHGVAFVPNAHKALVTVDSDRVMLVVDLTNGQIEQVIDTGSFGAREVIVTPDGSRAFVAHPGPGSLALIDLTAGRLMRTIDVGGGPKVMTLRPHHGELWVANSETDSISIVDVATATVREEFPVGAHPSGIAFSADGEVALISNLQSSSVSVYAADRKSVQAEVRLGEVSPELAEARPAPDGRDFGFSVLPVDLLVSPLGDRFWVACNRSDEVCEVSLLDYRVLARHPVDARPYGLAWSRFELPHVEAK